MGEVDDVNVIVDISGLSAGIYNYQIPVIELSAMAFDFRANEGSVNPAVQILSISNTGTGAQGH
jgi:hypothetical protein